MLNGPKRDTVSAETMTFTTHVVHVDLAALLGAYDVTDNVVLQITTPSGRSQRVSIRPNLLVPPHHEEIY